LLPATPEYSDEASWAALPWRVSGADAVPKGVARLQPLDVDVFFVHPTTYFGDAGWNGPTDGWLTRLVTEVTLRGQASAFNAAGRIYAPRFRQMTLAGFDEPQVRPEALAVAYSDVRRAFEFFLDHWSEGRPLILAGHSQGSRMVLRLLDEYFQKEGPLRARLVAAYPVGARVWSGAYERAEFDVPVCESPTQTGCLVTWRTLAEGTSLDVDDNVDEEKDGVTMCVNPLTWTPGSEPAPASLDLGSIPIPMIGGPGRPTPGLVGARCAEGFLWIDPPSPWNWRYWSSHSGGNWHAYDYALFYMNVRQNARARAEAFLLAD